VPAMLNFSAGPGNVASACRTAQIRTVLTSRTFIEKAKLENLITRLEEEKLRIVYMEDFRPQLTLTDKLTVLAASRWPHSFYRAAESEHNGPAVVLFTSGSEGAPK